MRVCSVLSIKINRETKSMWFGLAWFALFLKSHPNQTTAVKVGSICAFYRNIKNMTIYQLVAK
jgi:hypothetical protein